MQKLVTIYLDSTDYPLGLQIDIPKFLGRKKTSDAEREPPSRIEEHLEEYLSTGWKIKDIHGFGGSATSGYVSGWVVVVLESSD